MIARARTPGADDAAGGIVSVNDWAWPAMDDAAADALPVGGDLAPDPWHPLDDAVPVRRGVPHPPADLAEVADLLRRVWEACVYMRELCPGPAAEEHADCWLRDAARAGAAWIDFLAPDRPAVWEFSSRPGAEVFGEVLEKAKAAADTPPADGGADPAQEPPVGRPAESRGGSAYLTKAGNAAEANRRAMELAAADPAFAKPPNLTVRKWAAAIWFGKSATAKLPFYRSCKAASGEPVGLGRRPPGAKAEPLTYATEATVGERDGVLGELVEAEEREAERARLIAQSLRDDDADPSPLADTSRRRVQPKRV